MPASSFAASSSARAKQARPGVLALSRGGRYTPPMATRYSPPDYFLLDDLLTEEEKLIRDAVRGFVDERVLPIIAKAFREERFPMELVPEIASLGLLGASIQGYGCAGLGSVAYGLILQELERGDSGIRSFVSV